MKKYYLIEKYIGKLHCDRTGSLVLTAKLSQKVLKQLFDKGNKFVVYEER